MIQDTGNQDGVQWGPEIEIKAGEFPAFLSPAEDSGGQIKYQGRWCPQFGRHSDWAWRGVTAIRLPANHPYYAMPKQEEKPRRTPAQVARMEALVREMASQAGPDPRFIERARAIVAELDPVDGDLVEAREIAVEMYGVSFDAIRDYRAGRYDSNPEVINLKAGIKRGRELQKRGEV